MVDKDLISPSPGAKSSLPPRPPTRRGRTTETLSSRLNLPVVTLSHKLIQSKSLNYACWVIFHAFVVVCRHFSKLTLSRGSIIQ